jgi:hypothetical protein
VLCFIFFAAGSAADAFEEEGDAGATAFAFESAGKGDFFVSFAPHPVDTSRLQSPTMTKNDFFFMGGEAQYCRGTLLYDGTWGRGRSASDRARPNWLPADLRNRTNVKRVRSPHKSNLRHRRPTLIFADCGCSERGRDGSPQPSANAVVSEKRPDLRGPERYAWLAERVDEGGR